MSQVLDLSEKTPLTERGKALEAGVGMCVEPSDAGATMTACSLSKTAG